MKKIYLSLIVSFFVLSFVFADDNLDIVIIHDKLINGEKLSDIEINYLNNNNIDYDKVKSNLNIIKIKLPPVEKNNTKVNENLSNYNLSENNGILYVDYKDKFSEFETKVNDLEIKSNNLYFYLKVSLTLLFLIIFLFFIFIFRNKIYTKYNQNL